MLVARLKVRGLCTLFSYWGALDGIYPPFLSATRQPSCSPTALLANRLASQPTCSPTTLLANRLAPAAARQQPRLASHEPGDSEHLRVQFFFSR